MRALYDVTNKIKRGAFSPLQSLSVSIPMWAVFDLIPCKFTTVAKCAGPTQKRSNPLLPTGRQWIQV